MVSPTISSFFFIYAITSHHLESSLKDLHKEKMLSLYESTKLSSVGKKISCPLNPFLKDARVVEETPSFH